jgi:transposase
MKRRIPLEAHLTAAQIKARFLKCDDLVERSHWQTLWLLSRSDKNYTCNEVADLMGFTVDWVRKLVRRYNADPASGLRDERRKNGKLPVLDVQQQESLQRALEAAPADHGLWSGPKVARWISQELNQPVSAVTGWHYLTRLGWSLQVPRRRHDRSASPEEQEAFKKNSRNGSSSSAKSIPASRSKSGPKTKPASASSR